MTMYPFLTGFWTSAGASTALMFFFIYWHQTHQSLHGPDWVPWLLTALIFAAPLAAIGHAWIRFKQRAHRETTRFTIRKSFFGAILGGVVVLGLASLLVSMMQG